MEPKGTKGNIEELTGIKETLRKLKVAREIEERGKLMNRLKKKKKKMMKVTNI